MNKYGNGSDIDNFYTAESVTLYKSVKLGIIIVVILCTVSNNHNTIINLIIIHKKS